MRTFEQVVKKWWPYVCSIANNKIGSDAGDVASKVFEKMHNVWKSDYDADWHIISWLKITTTNMCVDHIRRANYRKKVILNYTEQIYDGKEPSTEQDNKEKELREVEQYVIGFLQSEIEKLPEKTKQVFRLHCIEQLNYRQIAEKLHIDKNTVTHQMKTARTILLVNVIANENAAPMLAQQLLFKSGVK